MWTCFLFVTWATAQFAPTNTGELRLSVTDSAGLPLQSAVTLISEANQVARNLETDPQGRLVAKRLPFGVYRLEVSSAGFASFEGLLNIQSALPTERRITLALAPVQTQVTVSPDETLLDLNRIGTLHRIGSETLQHRLTILPGRSLSDLVNTQPGWLLEANGILHPRGSEYQVQYVLDGLPITDNRSPSFAPEIEADDVRAMTILTGGYPAEYGRKLGGVIEVVTAGDATHGVHGSLVASAGSFGTATGYAAMQYGWDRGALGGSASVAQTDRYLDSPVEENFTNSGAAWNAATQFERELDDANRLGVIVRHGRTAFLVPNERLQQESGQRQDRESHETAAQLSYQRIVSGSLLGDLRGMARGLSSRLWSNPFSTPILAGQNRGFREVYLKGSITARAGAHEWKAGFDVDFGTLSERFSYRITDPDQFDRGTPSRFSFTDRGRNGEQALFVQDQMRFGGWTISAGVRWDHYKLLVDEYALSPRVGLAWFWPGADLVVRASYDRAFQTPAVENLLLASSSELESLNDSVVRLPVRPSLGNFYEAGFSKRLFGTVRFDATHFSRHMTNFADDDLLLNTGVSFPVAYEKAHIRGTEIKLELARWRALSGSVSYANMTGVGYLPITGGLLLGDDAPEALTSTDRFPVSQDQRNTVRTRVSYRLSPTGWVALAGSYGSGLPVEFTGDLEQAVAQYGERIVNRVDLERGRVRPSFSLDASGSIILLKTERRSVRVQADVLNLTNRLNVINFAGLFSGTAVAPPRSVGIRVQAQF